MFLRPRANVSGYFWIRNFFFPDSNFPRPLVLVFKSNLPVHANPTRIQHVSRYTLVRRTPLGTATATKTSLKKWIRTSSNFYLTYSDSFIVKCWQILLELNFKRLYQSSGKEREGRCLVFTCLTQRETGHFHVVVVQRRQRNLQKRVMHVQSCCFACLNLLLFCRSHCLRRRRCVSSLMATGHAS